MRLVLVILACAIILPGVFALVIWIGELCWNEALVPATGARPITFWQTFGLFVLSSILFRTPSRSSSK